MIQKKVEFYFKKKAMIHLEKKDGQWFNGLILEHSNKHLILFDKVVKEVFIGFQEIKKIEPYKERKK